MVRATKSGATNIGTNATGTAALGNGFIGVAIGSSGNIIGGTVPGARNVISGNIGFGIDIVGSQASGNVVQGNYIGTDASGTAVLGNGGNGVLLNAGSHNNTIGGTAAGAGNVIAGSAAAGVLLTGSGTAGNLLLGNRIGTDVYGMVALSSGGNGVTITDGASNNTVGGTAPGAGNLISGNGFNGIAIDTSGATGNLIQGNLIGTTADGLYALGNSAIGVTIGSSGNTIGGTAAGARNVISGNGGIGLDLFGSQASGNVVQGNLIGTNVNGTAALANASDGVVLNAGSHNNTIGGTAAGAGNVIGGNAGNAIQLTESGTTANLVQGNFIGTDAIGALNLGNGGDGVAVTGGAHGNTIGGTAGGAGNVIAFNGNDGARIDTGAGNAILHNSIFANANLGIELLNGGNNGQPAPQLDSAVAGGVTVIQGAFTGQALTTYTLEFFAADPSGQGQMFLGSMTVTTDATGFAVFTFTFGAELPLGQLLTATATDPANDTSEFSQTVAVSG